ncbi:ABC transporter ATP-binding protein [Bradyrhizobium sp. LA7.1]|uniref:ABC transporter ATP-binding protein n=1 Tax=Bradyrhizobium sp. LA7.1 TaxID=3156324 RepID=UPI003391620E
MRAVVQEIAFDCSAPVADTKEPILTVDGLTKSFGGLTVIQSLSFAVPQGSIFAVIGPNGAGKTTLFNLVTGVYKPETGSVRMAGIDVAGLRQHQIAALGVARTFQNLQIFFNLSAVENVMIGANRFLNHGFWGALLRVPSRLREDAACREASIALMCRVGLEKYVNARADAMPYGALKRLEIARALASKPKVLFLDEPAAGLTAIERVQIMELIRSLTQNGPTIILIEHDMKMVMGVSEHVLVLLQGRKLVQGRPEAVANDPRVIEAYLGSAEECHAS